ncbi:leucine efflux protein LeuE [Acinetobacter qingfengensis]|uniref:Leucine efflux protein LeuE n=1 Tax=Acinetobacter qingfengensis TaxID=1262585 RepID=A0A1E7RD31_9GAMM|nr:leucine efflux protein LeuE [Acinetobacter qingfengensis]KAA8732107.1 leucine efflux protein LeuE [Acinetobacter qingfengensis]OEY97186.1 leucine efflux protein LeuE [Acinetobacter qingfengensis]
MFGIIHLSAYVIGTILIILLPGPNSLYVMSTASRYGQKSGYQAATGVLVGDTILMLLTVIGAASLLKAVPALFIMLKIIGALYLGWLGIQLFKAGLLTWKTRHHHQVQDTSVDQPTDHFFQKALSISLLNPKAILFFLSFFIQFVDPNYAYPALSFFILGLILQICSFTYLSSLIFAGSHLAHFFRQYTLVSVTGILMVGTLFFGFAFKLVFSTI